MSVFVPDVFICVFSKCFLISLSRNSPVFFRRINFWLCRSSLSYVFFCLLISTLKKNPLPILSFVFILLFLSQLPEIDVIFSLSSFLTWVCKAITSHEHSICCFRQVFIRHIFVIIQLECFLISTVISPLTCELFRNVLCNYICGNFLVIFCLSYFYYG